MVDRTYSVSQRQAMVFAALVFNLLTSKGDPQTGRYVAGDNGI